jgi:exopolysaccharide biosynthesis polyprenyl glycosylphosphotransferase
MSARVEATLDRPGLDTVALDGLARQPVLADHVDQQDDAANSFGSRFLLGVSAWHRAPRNLLAVGLDAVVVACLVLAVTRSPRAAGVGTPALLIAGMLFGVWKRRMTIEAQGILWFARPFVSAAAAAALIVWAVTTTRIAVETFLVMTLSTIAIRSVLWMCLGWTRRHGGDLQRTLVVGPSHRIPHIEHRMRVFPEAGLKFSAAYVPERGDGRTARAGRELVDRLLAVHRVQHVLFVADEVNERVFKDFLRFGGDRSDFSVVMPLAPISANEARAHIGDLGLIPMRLRPSWGSLTVKRAFDLVISALLLVVISPLLAAIALGIRLDSPGPAIFTQRRVGRQGRTFTIYKFRSMVDGAEQMRAAYLTENVNEHLLFKLDHDPRVTRMGAFIRRLSLDELPQLFNVIKGEMSLVGPRPLPVDPDEFDPAAQIRHWVLPGITGLWQVHGANALSYADMVELDLAYIATRSLAVDLGLILRTVPALLVRRSPAY